MTKKPLINNKMPPDSPPLHDPNVLGKVGITALVPPELIYACGWSALDLNNRVPYTTRKPKLKLCSWTALWRDMLLNSEYDISKLVVVAGGDCLNAVVDGQKVAMAGLDTHYFFYPFHDEREQFEKELHALVDFLGGVKYPCFFGEVYQLKELGLHLDRLRAEGKVPSDAFSYLISFSDFRGDPVNFEKELREYLSNQRSGQVDFRSKIALIGVPPINHGFHGVCQEMGLQVVYDELPYEFLRVRGKTFEEITNSYINYSFAKPLDYRMRVIEKELNKRKVDGIIHYTQYACHHILEDELFRERFDCPLLTIQGDTPGPVSEQTKLRLEAFAEIIS